MNKPTPEELLAAQKAKREHQAEAQRKREEEARLEEERLQRAEEEAEALKARHAQLMSVTQALFAEIDKLNRKGPKVTISELTLNKVNKVIKSAKTFLEGEKDEFIDDVSEFIPAGDLPEYRDVVLILTQIIAGLKRYSMSHAEEWRELGVGD